MSIDVIGNVQLISAVLAIVATLIGGFWAVVKLALWQFEKRLAERFNAQEQARVAAKEDWDGRFGELDRGQRRLERDFMGFKAELPLAYVRREDSIREQTLVNAKLDALAMRMDTYFKGGQRE